MFQRLAKSKTFWTGIAAMVTAIGAKVTGEIETGVMLSTILTSLLAIFIRDGVAKNGST